MQRFPQDALRAQPHLRGVAVPRQVHQACHVPPVPVAAQEQPGLLALAQPQHAERDRGELLGGDLEELLARVVLEDLDEVLPVVAVPGQPGGRQDLGQLAADHGHAGDGRGVRRVRVQAEEPELPGDVLAPGAIRADLLDRDVVQVVGPVDGRPRVRLGQHQPLGRVLRPARDLRRQLAHRIPALPGVPEDAEPGSRHGAQAGALPGPHQVVLAVAEEGEVAVRQPAQQLAVLGLVTAGHPADIAGQRAGHRVHPRLVLHRHPHVVEHVPQFGRELIGRHPVPGRPELDVDPGLGQLAGRDRAIAWLVRGRVVGTDAEDPAQRAGHVPAHPQQRVHDHLDLGLVPVQFGGDRVDQVGHVVDDDVHDQAGPADRVQQRVGWLADLDQGPALRPGQAEPGVRLGDRRQPRRRRQVLGGDALVIRAQVAGDAVASAPVGQRLGVQGRVVLPGLRRLGQQGVPDLIRVTVRHRVHSFVSTNLIRRHALSGSSRPRRLCHLIVTKTSHYVTETNRHPPQNPGTCRST